MLVDVLADGRLGPTLGQNLHGHSTNVLSILLATFVVVAFTLLVSYPLYNLTTRGVNDTQTILNGNLPYTIDRLAFVVAQVIAMWQAAMDFGGNASWETFGELLLAGGFSTIFLLSVYPVVDAVVLPRINNVWEITTNHNWGVALAEAGSYLGIGFIIKGTLDTSQGFIVHATNRQGDPVGPGHFSWSNLVINAIFGLVGAAIMLLVVRLLLTVRGISDMIKTTPLPDDLPDGERQELGALRQQQQVAAGLITGGIALACGLIISPALAGDYEGLIPSTAGTVTYLLYSIGICAVGWVVISLLLVARRKTHKVSDLICDGHMGPALIRVVYLLITASLVSVSVYTNL